MNERLKNGGSTSQTKAKPTISSGSRQIMQQKKSLANASGSAFYDKPVHERLHKAALAKQRMQQMQTIQPKPHSQRGPSSNVNSSFEHDRTEKERITLSNRAAKRGFRSAQRKPPVPMVA